MLNLLRDQNDERHVVPGGSRSDTSDHGLSSRWEVNDDENKTKQHNNEYLPVPPINCTETNKLSLEIWN